MILEYLLCMLNLYDVYIKICMYLILGKYELFVFGYKFFLLVYKIVFFGVYLLKNNVILYVSKLLLFIVSL